MRGPTAFGAAACVLVLLVGCSSNAITLPAEDRDASALVLLDAAADPVEASADAAAADGDAAAPASTSRLVLTKDTATDPETGLVWQRGELDGFYEAPPDAACAALVLDGASGFRVPTLSELQTLVQTMPMCPMLDQSAFPGAYCDFYLSSTLVAANVHDAMMVDFYTGVVKSRTQVGPISAYNARCVRTGP